MQSGYWKYNLTETALLRVMYDVYAAADERRVTLLALLDLGAAFDCVDHDILLRRLRLALGSKARRWPGSHHSSVPELNEYITLDSCLLWTHAQRCVHVIFCRRFFSAALVGQTAERIFTKLSHVVDIRCYLRTY